MVVNWDLEHLCESKEKWQELTRQLQIKMEELKQLLKQYDSIENIKCIVRKKIEMEQLIEIIYCYPRRKLDLNYQDNEAKEMFDIAMRQYMETENINALFQEQVINHLELSQKFVQENSHYQRYFDLVIKNKNHVASNQQQYHSLQMQLESLKDIYRALIRQDMSFGEIEDETGFLVKATPEVMSRLSHSNNQEIRKRSFEVTMKAYQSVESTLATIYQAKLKVEDEIAQNKGFSSSLEETLFRNELPNDIISNLVDTVKKNIEVQHQFIGLKKKLLNLEEYHIYDMQMTSSNLEKDFSVEEAKQIIKKATDILGRDYQDRIEEAFHRGWLDLTLNETKRKDSFSCITYSGVPYTMLQYKNKIDSVQNLCHELGHAIHTSYTKENSFEYFEYPLFLAEIASKVNETLLYHYLLEHSEKEEKQYILEHMMTSFCTSLFSQTMLTEFEFDVIRQIREKKKIDSKYLDDLYLSLARDYYGESFTSDELAGCNWAKIPHFFLYSPYYVYQYATGVAIANKIASDLILDRNEMRKKYIEFLKVGNSKGVKEALSIVGIDLEDRAYIDNACQFMKEKMKVLKR